MTSEREAVEENTRINASKLESKNSTDNDAIHIIETMIEPFINETANRSEINPLPISTAQQNSKSPSAKTTNRCAGIFTALLASAFFTTGSFIIRELPVEMFDALSVQFILQAIIPAAIMLSRKYQLMYGSSHLIGLQILRTVLMIVSFFAFYLSYQYIPLPDLTICRYTQIVWTPILSLIIYRERISIPTAIAIIFTLTGVVLVAQPTFLFHSYKLQVLNDTSIIATNESIIKNGASSESHHVLGISLAMTCAICVALAFIINRRLLLLKIPQTVILMQSALIALPLLIVNHFYKRFILDIYATRPMFTWAFLIASFAAFLLYIAAVLTQRALKLDHPSIVTIALSSDILYAMILQNLFTGKKSNWFVLIGAILVTTSIFLVSIYKFREDQKNNKLRPPLNAEQQ